MASLVRTSIAVISMSMAGAVLVLLIGIGGPQDRPGQVMMWLAVGGGAAGAALWLCRWPSRLQSAGFAAVTTVSITLVCWTYPDPLAALLGCVAFTIIGAYVAFFHSTPMVLSILFVAAAVALGQALDMASEGRVALAVVDLFLVVQANIAVVLAIHGLMQNLRDDLTHADLDPLTGLLNRRAFRRQVVSLIARCHEEGGGYLAVAVLDLDHFKSLNDTYGHSVGDKALLAVSDVLRDAATPTAVIARSGGEEFLIADVVSSPTAVLRLQNISQAIAGSDIPITASLGTVYAALDSLPDHMSDTAISQLIDIADRAMYRAKGKGGNQCHHHGAWPG
ncbi:diguanylate cyclase domain-containing protein [Mycobacterium sp. BMJ-28]